MNTFIAFIQQHTDTLRKTLYADLDHAIEHYPLEMGKQAMMNLRSSVAAGKMMRGHLVLLGAHLHNVKITSEVYHAASAIEILHTGLLIHDDIIDNDTKRRNQDSLLYHYWKEGTEKHASEPRLFGQAMALCVGDMAFFLAMEILARHIRDPERLRSLLIELTSEVQRTCAAQMLDASYGQTDAEPDEPEIRSIYLYKTAHYTFSLPLMIGSAFGTGHINDQLKSLGAALGIIFQLKDDELGIVGDEQKIGKAVGSDIRENKKTLMRLQLLKAVTPAEKQRLQSIWGNAAIGISEITFVQQLLKKYQVHTVITKEIDRQRALVQELLGQLEQKGIKTKLLADLLEYNLTREK